MDKFSKSQYKDWKIIGEKEIIRFYHDHNKNNIEQHFRITVEKMVYKEAYLLTGRELINNAN